MSTTSHIHNEHCDHVHTRDNGDVLYVDFNGRHPVTIITTEDEWDCTWSRRSGLLVHKSGGGLTHGDKHYVPLWTDPKSTSFWAASCVELRIQEDWDNATATYRVDLPATEDELRKRGLTRRAVLKRDPFEDAIECDLSPHYCEICKDYFHVDDSCQHVWLARWGSDVGPGVKESWLDCKIELQRFAASAGIVRRLRAALVPFDDDALRRMDLAELGHDAQCNSDAMSDGASWALSLGDDTHDANTVTKQWLDDLVAEQDKRRRSQALQYVVRRAYEYVAHAKRADVLYASVRRQLCDGYPATAKQARARRFTWSDAVALRAALKAAGCNDVAIVHLRKRPRRGA